MNTQWWPSASAQAVAPVEEHEDLREGVRSILEELADHAAVRAAADSELGYSEATWKALTEDVSLASIAIPEAHGGLGFGLREVSVVLEETGAALLPEPVVSSAVLGARALAPLVAQGHEAYAGTLDGSTIITVWLGEGNAAGVTATSNGATWGVTGAAEAVQLADSSQYAILAADVGNAQGLFLIDLSNDGVSTSKQESLDITRKFYELRLTDVSAIRLDTLDGAVQPDELKQLRMIATACEHTGMIDRLLSTTREFLLQREQFGRKLGSFQALKHRLADILVDLERARSASQYAASIFDEADPGERALATFVAGAICQEAVLRVAHEAIQLSGGIGFTWEHHAHYYLRRALSDEALFGSADQLRGRISDLVVGD